MQVDNEIREAAESLFRSLFFKLILVIPLCFIHELCLLHIQLRERLCLDDCPYRLTRAAAFQLDAATCERTYHLSKRLPLATLLPLLLSLRTPLEVVIELALVNLR